MRIILLALLFGVSVYGENINPKVNSFKTMNAPAGTDPVAASPTDTLNFTSSNSTVIITGNSSTKTLDFRAVGGGGGGAVWGDIVGTLSNQTDLQSALDTKGDVFGPATSVDGEVVIFSGTSGKIIKRATGSGVAKLASGVLSAGTVALGSEVTGILPVANGGTGSNSALNGNRVMVSSGSTIIENAALTGSRVMVSGAGGLPATSSVTTTTLGFLDATSSIQTQLNGKQASGNYITSLIGDVTASGPGAATATLSNTAVTGQALTGFSSGAGTVSATDTILTASNKFNGNIALKAPLAAPSFTSSIGLDALTLQISGSYWAFGGNGVQASAARLLQAAILVDPANASGNQVNLQAPSNISGTYTFEFPGALGSSGQFLKRGSSNSTSWSTLTASDVSGVAPLASPTFTGTVTVPVTASRAVVTGASSELAASATTATEIGYVNGVTSAIQTQLNAKQATGNYITALTGEVTANGPGSSSATVANSAVIGKVLTGFSSGAGTVAATDTILQGFNKVVGNDALKAPLASPTFTGNVTLPVTASRALVTDGSSIATAATTTATEIGYVNGVTSAIQTQLNNKLGLALVEENNGEVEQVTDKTYTIIQKARYGRVINKIAVTCSSGSTTLDVKINGTNVTSCNGLSVTSTPTDTTCTAANVVAANDIVTLVTSSTSFCINMAFTVQTTRN